MSIPLGHLIAQASDLGHPNVRAAEMLAVALFTATVVRLAGGTLVVDRFGALAVLLVFSVVQMLALLLYAVVEARLALYLVSVLFGAGYGGIAMCYPVIVREHLPAAESGRRLGLVLLFGAIGMALGGGLADTSSISPAATRRPFFAAPHSTFSIWASCSPWLPAGGNRPNASRLTMTQSVTVARPGQRRGALPKIGDHS